MPFFVEMLFGDRKGLKNLAIRYLATMTTDSDEEVYATLPRRSLRTQEAKRIINASQVYTRGDEVLFIWSRLRYALDGRGQLRNIAEELLSYLENVHGVAIGVETGAISTPTLEAAANRDQEADEVPT